MRNKKWALAAGVLLLAGCFGGGDPVPLETPPFDGVSWLGQGGTAFSSAEMEAALEVLKVGVDTSGGTLRLPVSGSSVEDTFPYIWVANSAENTISKVDTRSGAELGVYRTAPETIFGNPSRTTVDQDGNVWVGNRSGNTVTKVGLKEFGQCVDRNGNGVIDSSTGRADIKAWAGSDVSGAEDECILKHVALSAPGVTTPSDIRTVAIDPQNNVFVGGYGQNSLFKINGSTGAIIASANTLQGHYGGVVDKDGNLWSMSSGSGKVQKTKPDLSSSELINIGHTGYGIAIDKFGKVWTTALSGTGAFSAFDPADPVGTLKVFNQTGSTTAQGIATDDNGDIFIASSIVSSTNVVGHYKQVFDGNGGFSTVTFVANYPVGSGPSGVAVDGAGNVWATNVNANSVSRITLAANPADAVVDTYPVGLGPYNYSDMTGRVVRNITNRQGTWEATFDSSKAGYAWGKVIWTLKEALPEGTNVEAQVKAVDAANRAEAQAKFGAIDYVSVVNDAQLSSVSGRFMKLRIRLTSSNPARTAEVLTIQIK